MTRTVSRVHAYALAGLVMSLLVGVAAAADPWDQLARAAADSDKASARKTLEALLLEQPNFYAGHFNLGTLEMDSDPDAAATHLEMATASTQIELVADALHNLALVRWKQGRLEDAVEAAARASKLRGDDATEQKLLSELRRVLIVRADEARRTAEEEARKLHMAVTSLPDAHALEPYQAQLTAAGGHGPYRFSLGAALGAPAAPTAGASAQAGPPSPAPPPPLPPGLDLEGDGRLHGIATKAGRYDFPVVISDGAKSTASATVTLTVQPAPAITTNHLPEAVLASPYQATVMSAGLDHPQWTISGLPAGLSASPPDGASVGIAGTARQAGTFTIHVAAADHQRHAERDIDLVVTDLFAAEPSILPPATVWAPYQEKLSVLGPVQSYTWSAPPQAGLRIAADGSLSGAPDKAGDHVLTATIKAEDGRQRTVTLHVHVNPPPVIEESSPIDLTRGQAVERPIKITGGTPPYQWSITDGVLPKGVRLDPDGTLRGAPTEIGKADITLAVADRWQAATQQKISVDVAAAKPTTHPDKQDEAKNDQKQDGQKQDGQKQDGQKQDDRKQEAQNKTGQNQGGSKQGSQGHDGQTPDDRTQHGQQRDDQAATPDHAPGQKQHQQDDASQKSGSEAQAHQQGGAHDTTNGGADRARNDLSAGQHGKPESASANQASGGGAQSAAANDAARQAQMINQAAVDRWLDQLPKEDRSVLRYQLLEGGDARPQYKGKTW